MTPKHDQERFDRWAPRYDLSILQRLMFGPVHDAVLDALAAAGPAPHDVLDVGCGTGRLLEAAARRWGQVQLTGVDTSKAMIVEAQRKHEGDVRFAFKQADAAALPLEPASFDAALSTMSFHHWGDQAAGIREVGRVLRPDGLFVLADVDAPLLFLWRLFLKWPDHAGLQTPEVIERLLEQGELAVVMHRRFWPLSRVQLFVARKREDRAMRS